MAEGGRRGRWGREGSCGGWIREEFQLKLEDDLLARMVLYTLREVLVPTD